MLRTAMWMGALVLLAGVSMTNAADYEGRMSVHGEFKLPYRWLEPARIEEGKKYPLIIFLHGAGERGTDNEAQLKHCCSRFLEPSVREQFPSFVMVPQCPEGKRWVEVHWGDDAHKIPETPSEPLAAVLACLDSAMAIRPIDPDRIYVMGLSMGGFGTWDVLCREPQRFAAAVPICGGGDESQAPRIKHIPVWVFHGDQDTVVKPERSRRMIDALKAVGGSPKYTEYPGVGHNSWNPAIDEVELLPWLFAQSRKPASKP